MVLWSQLRRAQLADAGRHQARRDAGVDRACEPDPSVLEAFVSDQLSQARADGTLSTAPLPLHQARAAHERHAVLPGQGRFDLPRADRGLRLGPPPRPGSSAPTARSRTPSAAACRATGKGPSPRPRSTTRRDSRSPAIRSTSPTRARTAVVPGRPARARTPCHRLGRDLRAGPGAPVAAHPGAETPLRSPWDLALRGSELYVALAGSHQVAVIALDEGTIEPVAGNGREALVDGLGPEAALAQPSGLSLQNDVLYVADSESSGVRAIDLRTGGSTRWPAVRGCSTSGTRWARSRRGCCSIRSPSPHPRERPDRRRHLQRQAEAVLARRPPAGAVLPRRGRLQALAARGPFPSCPRRGAGRRTNTTAS